MTEDPTDGELARRVALGGSGARTAESVLCRRFAPRIRLFGLRHLGDASAAQDLVQVVLVRVLEALRAGRVEDPDRVASFMLGTCRFASRDLRRAELRQRAIEGAAGVLAEDVSPREAGVDVLQLLRCLSKLPGRDDLIVRMTFLEEQEPEAIAARVGLTAGTVRVARHRALARLRDCLEKGRAA